MITRMSTIVGAMLLGMALGGCGGGGGGSGTPVTATAAQAPAVTAQPQSAVVVVGQSATFSVAASGTGPLTYQWTRDGAAIGGATSATLTVSGTQLTDSGSQYSVTVSNAAGSVSSVTVALQVTPAALNVASSATSVPAMGFFTLTMPNGFAPPAADLQPVAYKYALEYTLGSNAVITVPALVESDGSIKAAAPPAIANQTLGAGSVSVRIKRTLQTSPTAAPLSDFSNPVTLNVTMPAPTTLPAGWATRLLMLVGKYSSQHAATYDNAFMDSTTSASLSAFDFDAMASNVVAGMSPEALALSDKLAQAELLSVYDYDIVSGNFVQPAQAVRTGAASAHPARRPALLARPQDDDLGIQEIAASMAQKARDVTGKIAEGARIVGLVAAMTAVVVESPVLLPIAATAALVSYVAVSTGTTLGFAFDVAAASADPSPTPQSNFKVALRSLSFLGANTLSTFIDASVNPVDGLVTDYLEEKLAPGAFLDYEAAATFVVAESGDMSGRVMAAANSIVLDDPATPAADKAQMYAEEKVDAPQLVTASLDAGSAAQIAAGENSSDWTVLINSVNALDNVLLTLTAVPNAADEFSGPLAAFQTCAQPPVADMIAVSGSLGPDGATDAQMAQMTQDLQAFVSCGATLASSLRGVSAAATDTETQTSGSDYYEDTVANCDGNGCWITETVQHADGTTGETTGYRTCSSDGFCPLQLDD